MFFRSAISLVIVSLFSVYSFCYATLDAGSDYKVMLVLSFLGGSAGLLPPQTTFLSRRVVFLYILFLGLATLSVIWPFSEYANITRLIESLVMLGLSSLIVISFGVYEARGHALLKWGLLGCLLVLELLIILHQLGVPVKSIFPEFAGFRPVSHDWNQKHYSFWLIFLTWGVIALHWKKSALSTFISLGVILLTGGALLTGYSDSAPVAFGFSLIIFALLHIRYPGWLRVWQIFIGLYVLGFPWVWSLLPTRWFALIKSLPLNNVRFRVDLYHFSAQLILNQWLGGYGIGSAASLMQPFPFETGGHPHNIVLYFWLELGFLGAILLALVLITILAFVHNATHDQEYAPAVWALAGAGLVIFSFSFDIWLPGIVLTYCMWLAIMRLACQNNPNAPSAKLAMAPERINVE